jgi:hypothetical protein
LYGEQDGESDIGENAHEDVRIEKWKMCAHDSHSWALVADLMHAIRKSTEIVFSIVLHVAKLRSIGLKASAAAMFCRYSVGHQYRLGTHPHGMTSAVPFVDAAILAGDVQWKRAVNERHAPAVLLLDGGSQVLGRMTAQSGVSSGAGAFKSFKAGFTYQANPC